MNKEEICFKLIEFYYKNIVIFNTYHMDLKDLFKIYNKMLILMKVEAVEQMTSEEAILYLEHTSSDDFNLEEHQIQNRLNAIQFLLKENEKLKTQLSGTTFCYDEKEHRDLKAKIKELERIIELCHLDAKETLATINYEQESQQKEFINYLQRGINHYTAYVEAMDSAGPSIYSNEYDNSKIKIAIYKGILQKYKEIIGVKDE